MPLNQQMVLTPGGYKPRSKVFRVAEGSMVGGRADVLVQAPAPAAKDPPPTSKPDNRWVAYTEWMYQGVPSIQAFSGKWTVPPAPQIESDQTIFIFIGLQNTKFIFQPVLQWGRSHAGGGSYWSISNWYTDGSTDNSFVSCSVPVEEGQQLVAKIELIGQQDRSFKYKSSFEGYPGIDVVRDNVKELLWVYVVLESHNVGDPGQYPAADSIRVEGLSLSTATSGVVPAVVTPAWQKVPNSIVSQEPHVNFPSGGGDWVDLFFR